MESIMKEYELILETGYHKKTKYSADIIYLILIINFDNNHQEFLVKNNYTGNEIKFNNYHSALTYFQSLINE